MSKHAAAIFKTVESSDTCAAVSSRRRCIAVPRLDPDSTKPPERDTVALREARQREERLLAVAAPHLDQLHSLIADRETLVFVADRHAMVLGQRTGRGQDAWRRKAAHSLGSRHGEGTRGTCALRACLAEKRPVLVEPGHHSHAPCHAVTATNAPIFGPDGLLLGSLGYVNRSHSGASRAELLFMATASAARRIEIELFAATFPETRLMMASPDGLRANALLAIDGDDRVVGATHAARELLGLTESRLEAGFGAGDLFGAQYDLAQAEARLIDQAMVRHAKNRSAVARALGISRSTLYRKLAKRPQGITTAPYV